MHLIFNVLVFYITPFLWKIRMFLNIQSPFTHNQDILLNTIVLKIDMYPFNPNQDVWLNTTVFKINL